MIKKQDKNDQEPSILNPELLNSFVSGFLDRRLEFLDAVNQFGCPLYLIDVDALTNRANEFRSAFEKQLDEVSFFFAMKSNNHPVISKSLIERGFGIDVSSGEELVQAVNLGTKRILFSGPGKTEAELELASKYGDKITILMDSFVELERLNRVALNTDRKIKTGVRLNTDDKGLWQKFGITLESLQHFFHESDSTRNLDLCGLQFHTSWNLNPSQQVAFIKRLGNALFELEDRHLDQLEFLDIGGGYWPDLGEWVHNIDFKKNKLEKTSLTNLMPLLDHYRYYSNTINTFAIEISDALRRYIFPFVDCEIYLEPGRWICNDAMHILLSILDQKQDGLYITDGGTNAIGWERFETDYFPVINLSRPLLKEFSCLILGSLCTPHDVWGYSCFGQDLKIGDIILIPNQGAYTFSLKQNFIKPLPKVVIFDNKGIREYGK